MDAMPAERADVLRTPKASRGDEGPPAQRRGLSAPLAGWSAFLLPLGPAALCAKVAFSQTASSEHRGSRVQRSPLPHGLGGGRLKHEVGSTAPSSAWAPASSG